MDDSPPPAGSLTGNSDRADTQAQLVQLTRSVAHAADCPMAVLLLEAATGELEVSAYFGLHGSVESSRLRILAQAVRFDPAGLLIVNDSNDERRLLPKDGRLFGAAHPVIRFVAALPIARGAGEIGGFLVVADTAPHAGLNGATTYVLRTHASQISFVLEWQSCREANGREAIARRSKMERLRLLESVVINANDSVLITEAEPIDLPGPRIVYCNAAFTRTTGYSEEEVIGRTPRLLQAERTDKEALARLRTALAAWKPVEVELLNRRKDGTEFWVELSIAPVADERGWFTHWVSVQRDVTDRKHVEETTLRARVAEAANQALGAEIQERKRIEDQLLYTAFHDDLTKLRNRPYFMDRLIVSLSRLESDQDFRCAVLFIDLDRFKMVNDSLGHRAGDLLLMEVARRLETCLRRQDTLARIGGDEFAVLIEDDEGVTSAASTARRIIEAMRQPMWIGKQEVFSSCSIGVVQATALYRTPEELLRDADIAMYEAKRHDKGSYAIFAGSMHDSAVEALRLQTDLQNALMRNEFFLVYQPICSASTGEIVGVEALIRWQHPTRGIVSPLEFIAAAEQTGVIREIGRWVLREAFGQMRTWCDRFPGLKLRLGVNVSGSELQDPGFVADLQKELTTANLGAHDLQLEVTEAIFLRRPEHIEQVLSGIRELGVRVALDDFGTGYSSLSYLDRYEIDTLKIDRSFVASMLTRPRTLAIVRNIVSLAHALGLDIVAEGVEEEEQLRMLAGMGCTTVQGYFLSRPLSVAEIDVALAEHFALRESDAAVSKFMVFSREVVRAPSAQGMNQVA
ncbi:MAG: EAL domain-containing protein [Bradyrhizobium sp.]|nr:EAL domain-containing protein [Bradyrhizobium sp.]